MKTFACGAKIADVRSGRVHALNVLSFKTFFARNYFEGDFFAFFKGFKSGAHYGRVMHENVLTGALGDETEPFFVIKPFYFAASHIRS